MNRTLWVGVLAALLVLAGAYVALGPLAPRPAPKSSPPTAAELDHPGEDVVAKAMAGLPRDGGASVDSSAIKARWHDEVNGMDLSPLTPAQREIFLRFANSERCTCGCGYTLAGCKASDMSCEISGPRLDALMDSVRTGKIRSARGVRARPSSG
ncbi:MAG TPA: hypothetical protein VMJ70_06910 [Candidatus Sulfotelmatobacter sp.]|nr:hypothetical protein [Candidatus Sulfotelmatobacter sp.]